MLGRLASLVKTLLLVAHALQFLPSSMSLTADHFPSSVSVCAVRAVMATPATL